MKRLHLGSLTILFAVTLICVAVLSVLCVSTARADRAVTEHYTDHLSDLFDCERAGQEWLAQVDAALAESGEAVATADLPEGCTLEGNELSAALTRNGVTLTIRLELFPRGGGRYRILTWSKETQWAPDGSMDLL